MKNGAETLRNTPLAALHEKMGAQMTAFAGWRMPLYYTSVLDEHRSVREQAGLFDVSHMGEIEIRGTQAFAFLQHLLPGDLLKLPPRRSRYTLLCREDGGMIDDCLLYCFSTTRYWLVVNAANTPKVLAWLRRHAGRFNATIRDLTPVTAKIDIQGPLAMEIAGRLSPFPVRLLERFHFVESRMREIPAVISRSGYTGEDGLEIFFESAFAELLWDGLLDSDQRLKPAGLGARDSLRIEACYPLYGRELSEQISPVEAGLGWAVDHHKEDEFIGKDVLLRQKRSGAAKKLYAFAMRTPSIPRSDCLIKSGGEKVGWVTSGTFSPFLKKAIGLGYIEKKGLSPGDVIDVEIRESLHAAEIMARPIYPYKGGRS